MRHINTLYSRHFRIGLLVLVVTGLMGCASSRQGSEVIHYPADISDPYLTLEQVIEGDQETPKGLLSRFLGFLVGPESKFALNMPTDMVVDSAGRLLIVESEAGYISIYTKIEGEWLINDRVSLTEILHPTSIAAGPDRIFVSDLMGGDVQILDYNFNHIGSLKHEAMIRPGGLTYDSFANHLLIADPPANRVFVFSPEGEFVAQIGRTGNSHAQLQSPLAIATDPENGHIYILDGMTRKIKHYDAEYQYVDGFGEYDQVPGSFAFPKGIALAVDGTIFVGDAAFGNVQMFDPTGALLFFFGETGVERGQFLMPRNLFIDSEQRLFVADPYNNRVQIFRYYAQ